MVGVGSNQISFTNSFKTTAVSSKRAETQTYGHSIQTPSKKTRLSALCITDSFLFHFLLMTSDNNDDVARNIHKIITGSSVKAYC